MRHNAMRDTEAFFLEEAKCKDVRIEPALLPVQPTSYSWKTNIQDEARFDIATVGPFKRTFFAIMVTHSNCDSNLFRPLDKIYSAHEKERKDLYEEGLLQSESVLCPSLSQVKNHTRIRFRFDQLQSTLIALRRVRGKQKA